MTTRSAILAALSALALLPALPTGLGAQHPPEANDPRADSLVSQWIEALGGMETFWNRASAKFTLTTEIYDTLSGRLRRTRPRYVTIAKLPTGEASRVERWEGDDYVVQGFDGGNSVWAVMNGRKLGPGDKDYDEALYVARDVYYWISLPYKLRDPGVFLHYTGGTDDGLHEVSVSFGEGVGEHDDTWFYYFRDDRVWPVQVHYIEEGRTYVNTARWEDFSESDGYVYPGKRVYFDDRGRVTKIIRMSDVVINPGVDPSVFLRP